MELPTNLKPLSELMRKNNSLYTKIRRRQRNGKMTTYILNGQVFYDTQEEKDGVKWGRPLKNYTPQKKGVVDLTNVVYNLENFAIRRKKSENNENKGE